MSLDSSSETPDKVVMDPAPPPGSGPSSVDFLSLLGAPRSLVEFCDRSYAEILVALVEHALRPDSDVSSSDNFLWLRNQCSVVKSSTLRRGGVIALSTSLVSDLQPSAPTATSSSTESPSPAPAIQPDYVANHCGLCLAEVVGIDRAKFSFSLKVIRSSIEDSDESHPLRNGAHVSFPFRDDFLVALVAPSSLAECSKLRKREVSSSEALEPPPQRFRDDTDSSGELRVDLDGVAVTIPVGKNWREKVAAMQHLIRLMPPDTLSLCFPSLVFDEAAFRSRWTSASLYSDLSAPAALSQFREAGSVAPLAVVHDPALMSAFMSGRWNLSDFSGLSLLSFRSCTASSLSFGRKITPEARFDCADLVSRLFDCLGVFYAPFFLRAADSVVGQIRSSRSPCARWGDEFLFISLNLAIGRWFWRMRSDPPSPDTVLRGPAGCTALVESISASISRSSPESVFPHALFYAEPSGFKALTLPYSSGSAPKPQRGLPSNPPSSGGKSFPCGFHLAGLLGLTNKDKRPFSCNNQACPREHPASFDEVSPSALEMTIRRSRLPKAINSALAKAAAPPSPK